MTELSLLGLDKTDLDLSDVLAVVTSRAETRYSTELAEAKQELQHTQGMLKKTEKERDDKKKEEAKEAGERLAATFRESVVAAGGKVKIEVCSRNCEDDEGNLTAVVFVSGDGKHWRHSHEASFTTKCMKSPELQELYTKVEKLQQEVEEKTAVALAARKRLSNVPLLERQARAKLAEAKLKTSAEGQEVLDLLVGDLERSLAALPCV